MRFSRLSTSALFVVGFGLLGCGGGGGEPVVEVQGKLLKGGQPLVIPANLPPGDPGVVLRFISTGSKGDAFAAKIDPATGEFTVPGLDGRGIKPGPYNIDVQVGSYIMEAPKNKVGGPSPTDMMKAKMMPGAPPIAPSKSKSDKPPITRTVEAGKEIVIDLDNPNG